jgi:hypothetical protein
MVAPHDVGRYIYRIGPGGPYVAESDESLKARLDSA